MIYFFPFASMSRLGMWTLNHHMTRRAGQTNGRGIYVDQVCPCWKKCNHITNLLDNLTRWHSVFSNQSLMCAHLPQDVNSQRRVSMCMFLLPSFFPSFLLSFSLSPSFLPSFLPSLLPSLSPSFPLSFLPSFLPSSFLPSFHPSLLPASLPALC
jgi:hypothetical protein